MKLSTIQKRDKLNDVYPIGGEGPGGAYHRYSIETVEEPIAVMELINFQKGPRKEKDSVPGVLDCDLLEIVRHRLQCFQKGPYATRENAIALTHIEEALLWMNKRVEDRAERGVLGTEKV